MALELVTIVVRTRHWGPLGEVILWWTAMGHRSVVAVAMAQQQVVAAVGSLESPRAAGQQQDVVVPETPLTVTPSTSLPPLEHWSWPLQHCQLHRWYWWDHHWVAASKLVTDLFSLSQDPLDEVQEPSGTVPWRAYPVPVRTPYQRNLHHRDLLDDVQM